MLKFKTINVIFLIVIVVLLAINSYYSLPFYSYLFVFLTWFTITVIGSFNILWNYHVNAFNSNPKVLEKKIAITFDDGPHPEVTPKILDLLRKYQVKATFFCIGKNLEKHPGIAKQIISDGHIIGNHSYTHSDKFGFFSKYKVLNDINKCNEFTFSLLNLKMNLFRPPFGVTNPSISNALKETQHFTIGWNVRSLDTVIKDPEQILKRITKKIKKGDVILLHDTNERTTFVLEQLLLFLQENEFETTTVDELFNIDAYA